MSALSLKEMFFDNYSENGAPFVEGSARKQIVLPFMEYSFDGSPFVRNKAGVLLENAMFVVQLNDNLGYLV